MKTAAQAQANFQNSIAYIPSRYTAGVQAADWLTPAKSNQSETNYANGVSQAVANHTRQNAIASMANTDWQTAAVNKGAPVIGARIQAALQKWSANWSPMYSQVQQTVTGLPQATTDYMANINNRLVPVVKAWKTAAGKQ